MSMRRPSMSAPRQKISTGKVVPSERRWTISKSAPAGVSVSLIPAPAVVAVDTTGAGDAHAGVFLAGLAAALPPEAAASRANAAAALAVTRAGSAVSPSRAELDAFLAAEGRSRPTP